MHIKCIFATAILFTLTMASPFNPFSTPTPNPYTTDCAFNSNTTCGASTIVTTEMCDSGICNCDGSGTYTCPDLDPSCTGAMLQAVCEASFQCSCAVLDDPCPGFPGCGIGLGHGF